MVISTPVSRSVFLAVAIAVAVACAGESDQPEFSEVDTRPTTPAPTATPSPTATPERIVGIRGAAELGNLVFPSFGNGGYDVSHYDLDLSIDLDANTLDVVATITITATANLLAFNLDFAGPEISAVLVNDVPASFTREDLELIIEPAIVIADGSEFTVRITYGGTPEPLFLPDFPFPVGWTRFGDSVLVHGPGLAWYPKNETPLDKATFNIRLTVPKPLTATANGELTATIDNGDTSTYDWELKVPIGGVAFAVSDSVLDSRDGPADLVINNYFPPDFAQSSRERFDIVPEVIELFTDQLGPFPY